MLVKSQVKYIQSLSQKKLRDEQSVFVAEGPKIINELLAAGNVSLKQLFATRQWIESNDTARFKEEIILVEESELERISFLSTPNQVLGLFAKPTFDHASLKGQFSLLLDTIQDPGNLGTIVRCADWFGIRQVFCNEDSADVFSPKVVQSTMGSISRVQVSYVQAENFLKNNDMPVFAAVMDGQNLYQVPRSSEGIIIIGNESKGINPALITKHVQKITIPRAGKAESLNAAVATGIILSHLT